MKSFQILQKPIPAAGNSSLTKILKEEKSSPNLPVLVSKRANLPARAVFPKNKVRAMSKSIRGTPVSPELFQPPLFTVEEVNGVFSRAQGTLETRKTESLSFTLPFGSKDRFVNAATFKALAGHPGDTLLCKHGPRWRIVKACEVIDLCDQTKLYKLGALEIYS